MVAEIGDAGRQPLTATANPTHSSALRQGLHGLEQWRDGLQLSGRETSLLAGSLASLDRQLQRLRKLELRVAVFGLSLIHI